MAANIKKKLSELGIRDTTKIASVGGKEVTLQHNLYDIVGETLLEGFKGGRLNPRALQGISAEFGIDFGGGLSASLEYAGRRRDLKATLTKRF